MARPNKISDAEQAAIEAQGMDNLLNIFLSSRSTPWVLADGHYSKVRATCGPYPQQIFCAAVRNYLTSLGIENSSVVAQGDGLRVTITAPQFKNHFGAGVHVDWASAQQQRAAAAEAKCEQLRVRMQAVMRGLSSPDVAQIIRPQPMVDGFVDRLARRSPVAEVGMHSPENAEMDGHVRLALFPSKQWRGVGGGCTNKVIVMDLSGFDGSYEEFKDSVKRVFSHMNGKPRQVAVSQLGDDLVEVRVTKQVYQSMYASSAVAEPMPWSAARPSRTEPAGGAAR